MEKRSRQVSELQEMSRLNLFELRLYRCLGILPFREFLFGIERLRHWRDGGKNKNYHLGKRSVSEAGRFEGYLLYNTFLHVVSLLLFVIFFVVKYIHYPSWHPWEIILYVLCLLNVWCIMLQRYNWLRIRQLRLRHSELRTGRVGRVAAKTLGNIPEGYRPEQMKEDVRLVKRMLESLAKGEIIFLENRDAAGLQRMSAMLACADGKRRGPQVKPNDGSESISSLAEACGTCARPYSKIERRVSGLQRLFSAGKSNMILSPCGIVTEDQETERAFAMLFPRDSLSVIEEKLRIIETVMEKHLSENECEGRSDHDGEAFS